MANRNEQDPDERYDPYSENAQKQFGPDSLTGAQNHEKSGVTGDKSNGLYKPRDGVSSSESARESEKKSVGDTAAGKAATTAAGVAGGTVGKTAAKFIGKIKMNKKKVGAGTILTGFIVMIALIGIGFLTPASLLIQVKESLAEKFNDTAAALTERQQVIIVKQLAGSNTRGCGAVKIKCRYSGFSDRQIKNFERQGIVFDKGKKNTFGRTPILSMQIPEVEGKVDAANFRSTMLSNPSARGLVGRATNPVFTTFNSKAFGWVSAKYGISKRLKLAGVTEASLKESWGNSIKGRDASGADVRPVSCNNEGKNCVDSNGNSVTGAEADELNNSSEQLNKQLDGAQNSGKKVAVKLAKGGVVASLVPGAGIVDGSCTAYSAVRMIGFGAMVAGQWQMIQLMYSFGNVADATKASHISNIPPEQVEFIANKVTKPDENGITATDSFGLKYAMHGDTALPDDEEARANIFQYSAAGGVGSTIAGFTGLIDKYLGDTPAETCNVVKNPWTQGGLIIGGLALAFFTGGGSVVAGAASAAGLSVVFASIYAVALPILTNLNTNQLVNADTLGGDFGNGVTGGAGSLNAQVSQAHGLSVQTKDQYAVYDKFRTAQNSMRKEGEVALSSPFDISNPSTPAFKIAGRVNEFVHQNRSPLELPTDVIAASYRSMTQPVLAANNEFDICTDEVYTEKNLAADPFCNLRFGLSNEALGLDPETIGNELFDTNQINEEGEPVGGSDYEEFIKECVQRERAMGDSGEEFQDSDGLGENGINCIENGEGYKPVYTKYRVFFLDNIVVDSFDNEPNVQVEYNGSNSGGNVSSGSLPGGDNQELAQEILASGNFVAGPQVTKQITDYSNGKFDCNINSNIIRLLSVITEKYRVTVTSINRQCTGQSSTGAGKRSLHYKDGGGHAIDIGIVDGAVSNGITDSEIAMIKEVAPLLPANSRIGQEQCRSAAGKSIDLPVEQFNDTCNHTHIEVPSESDTD